ncbi:MAG TPA: 2-C-methyl-D-erythritol 2,4-cyclodiphosphate synthase [Candidatus Limiplasma sp.]|nr:2-C-methyl-D-erythritol 2,4-cyclodiphosphate synthase [Candidatus Limiplasma sp.]
MTRIGFGMDVHALTEGRKLVLCGVDVPHELGLAGHSDADVATHALMDALLGALALGDIGKQFPDTDDRYLGISSLKLLEAVMERVAEKGYTPVNVDITIAAQRPKLAPYIGQMRETLADCMRLDVGQVSVKATTTERLGFEGEEKGITAYAVCLLESVQ